MREGRQHFKLPFYSYSALQTELYLRCGYQIMTKLEAVPPIDSLHVLVLTNYGLWAGRMSCQCQVRISIVWKTAETITMITPRNRSPQPSAHCIFYVFRTAKEDSIMCWLEEALLTERRRARSMCEFLLRTQGRGTHSPSCAAGKDLFTLGRECRFIGGLVYTTNV